MSSDERQGAITERLPFELDPSIIHHIVYSQAGSLSKAIIELVMNSIDAEATRIDLTINQEGFCASDDGRGFCSRSEVLAWFGRFGTPHEVGDATFGRFRLGRGQIMAFARTTWESRMWTMAVDVPVNGYSYELSEYATSTHEGCCITGTWYEPLDDDDLRTLLFDLVELIRWTPVPVFINGKQVSRDPKTHKWTTENEDAWFLAEKEGAVAIYNQGILVRFDSGHVWGAGGTIVTKRAIDLNVSRTEILRKTCPVWARIYPVMRELCRQVAEIDDGRIDENARCRWAEDVLKGGTPMLRALLKPVFTLVPGRHVSLKSLLRGDNTCLRPLSILEERRAMSRAESIQALGSVNILAPSTMQRFRCRTAGELEALMQSLPARIEAALEGMTDAERMIPFNPRWPTTPYNTLQNHVPRPREDGLEFIPFAVLDAKFVQNASILDPRSLPKPQRRVWTALRWALEHYAAEVRAFVFPGDTNTARRIWGRGMHRKVWIDYRHDMMLVPGRSTTMEGWTDGMSYVAINVRHIENISRRGVEALDEVWRVFDHELAHQGDSIEAGHDAAFFERHHDIVMTAAPLAGLYKALFLRKWLLSYEGESRRKNGRTASQNALMQRLETERRARGEDLRQWRRDERKRMEVPMPDMADLPQDVLASLNASLCERGLGDTVPDLEDLRSASAAWRKKMAEEPHQADEDSPCFFDPCFSDEGYEEYREEDTEPGEYDDEDIVTFLIEEEVPESNTPRRITDDNPDKWIREESDGERRALAARLVEEMIFVQDNPEEE